MADEQNPLNEATCPNCAALDVQRAQYKEGWQRALADYVNLQKDVEREKSEWSAWSKQHILVEVIPIFENLKKAFAHKPSENELAQWKNWASGIELITKQFADFFKNHGIEEIKTVGEAFNPEFHEIVAEEPANECADHTIIREVDGGYTLNGKVLRVAKVVVAKL